MQQSITLSFKIGHSSSQTEHQLSSPSSSFSLPERPKVFKDSMGSFMDDMDTDKPAAVITSQYSPAALGQLNVRLQALQLGAPEWAIFLEPGTERHVHRFLGSLTIGPNLDEKIVVHLVESGSDPRGAGLPSKKDVKAALAQKALIILEAMPSIPKGAKQPDAKGKDDNGDGINWIGRILEYNNSLPLEHRVLTYTETSIPTPFNAGHIHFSCTLDLAIPTASLAPELQSFELYTTCKFPQSGMPGVFLSKKAAKYHCSQLAGHELVNLGLLRPDGTLPPKATTIPASIQNTDLGDSVLSSIPLLCDELGLPPPRYEFASPSGDPSNVNPFTDCSAHFPPICGLPDPAAVVRNVYGKKRAKEECARLLIDVLAKAKRWRLRGGGAWEDA